MIEQIELIKEVPYIVYNEVPYVVTKNIIVEVQTDEPVKDVVKEIQVVQEVVTNIII